MGEEVGLVERHVDTHLFTEHPRVRRVVDPGDGAGDSELVPGEAGDREIGLVGAGDGCHHVTVPDPCQFEHDGVGP